MKSTKRLLNFQRMIFLYTGFDLANTETRHIIIRTCFIFDV